MTSVKICKCGGEVETHIAYGIDKDGGITLGDCYEQCKDCGRINQFVEVNEDDR